MVKRRGIRVIPQRKDWDCGISALAMLLGCSYGDVSAHTRHFKRSELRYYGLNSVKMVEVAAALGTKLAVTRPGKTYFAQPRTGIVGILWKKDDGHWAVVKDNVIICPTDGAVWNINDYCARFKCKITMILSADSTN